ncbi:hypothetical protein CGZ80_13265 [Rhodopirellula sp. MGV]|nr:hypothetical protein CGZ80_13265 [Rhodopirellula sp. MGV]PNY38255.1 glycosyltransferase [Rhodopirellula baltica]
MISSMRGGGSERQVLLLAQHLSREHFEPHLYLSEAAGPFLSQVPSDVTIHAYDAAVASKPSHTQKLYFPGRALRDQTRFVRQVIDENQIDVVYDRTFHMSLLAGGAAKGIRRVSTIVSPPHLALPSVESRFVWLKRQRLARSYRRSDAVVAVSRQAALSAERYYRLKPRSVQVIPNPVRFSAPARDLSDARSSGRTRLVCVGRMTSEKGHADLIDAMASVVANWPADQPPPELHLVGDGVLRGELEHQSQRLHLQSVCKFIGAVDDATDAISGADALILPSRFEGMPNVVLESMALGTPVIATKAGGTIELQHDQPTAFWADVASPASLADAILEFARRPDLAQQHSKAAWQMIQTHHDLNQTVKRIETLLAG